MSNDKEKHTADSDFECTCYIINATVSQRQHIVFCPLHKAALDMLEALRELLEHEGERDVNGIGMESDSNALEQAKIQARAAIAKAEGK